MPFKLIMIFKIVYCNYTVWVASYLATLTTLVFEASLTELGFIVKTFYY